MISKQKKQANSKVRQYIYSNQNLDFLKKDIEAFNMSEHMGTMKFIVNANNSFDYNVLSEDKRSRMHNSFSHASVGPCMTAWVGDVSTLSILNENWHAPTIFSNKDTKGLQGMLWYGYAHRH